MNYISVIGSVGATLTTVSMIPQIVKIWKTKHTEDISLFYFLILATGIALWCVYGLLLNEPPIYTANIISLFFCLIVIGFKIKYG